jgi:hypothetical protein
MQCIDFIRERMAEKELPSHEDNNDSNGRFIQGVIIGRRSLGRNLSFADIALQSKAHSDGTTTSNDDVPINIIFTRQSFLGPEDNDDTLNEAFPTKGTSLPYGASIQAQLGHCQKVKSKISGGIEDVWEVTRWKITEHPKELAKDMASLLIDDNETNKGDEESSKRGKSNKSVILGSGAMSCSDYLKARGEAFEEASKRRQQLLDHRGDAGSRPTKDQYRTIKTELISKPKKIEELEAHHGGKEAKANNTDPDDIHHGGKQAKAKRAKIFASWILETFFDIPMSAESMIGDVQHDRFVCQPCQSNDDAPAEYVPQMHVFDVAGGKGHLSLELILHQVMHTSTPVISRCTIIDPVVRKSDAKQRQAKLKKAESRLRKQNDGRVVGTIDHIATCFTKDSFPEIYAQAIPNADLLEESRSIPSTTLLLGLHPDEPTEDILDAALEHNLSVAIIPCCLFSSLFPSRTIKRSSDGNDGKVEEVPVRDYNDFLQYLLDKDESLQLSTLPFEGKNKVIYRRIKSD